MSFFVEKLPKLPFSRGVSRFFLGVCTDKLLRMCRVRYSLEEYGMSIDMDKWLGEIRPEYQMLSKNEKKAIADFSLLWPLFEGHCLGKKANFELIKKFVDSHEQEELLGVANAVFDYFANRYVRNGEKTEHYKPLKLEKSGRRAKEAVDRALFGNENDRKAKLLASLLIIFRYRNNLFHGEKWTYNFLEQEENFIKSIQLLKSCIEASRK